MLTITIKGTNIEVTPGLRAHAEKALGYIEKFVGEGDATAQVEIVKVSGHHKQGEVFRAEMLVRCANGTVYHVESTKEDMYAAIDDARDELSRRIRKGKERVRDLMRRGGAAVKNLARGFKKFRYRDIDRRVDVREE